MRELWWRLRARLSRRRLLAERTEELQHHLDMEIAAGVRRGLSLEEARREARGRAGLVSEGLESVREELGFRWLDGTALDLRHAVRSLARSRGFGLAAALVLTTSVAITTLVFCLVEGVILRPLPYAEPERLVRVYDESPHFSRFPMSIGHYFDLRAHARSLEGVALYTGRDIELTAAEGHSRRLTGVAVTSDFFHLLGRPPALGRAFTDADLTRDGRNAILSDRLWRDRFAADPDIVGKTIRLDRQPWTVVGGAPPGLQHVGGEYRSPLQGESVDIWLPLALDLRENAIRYFHYCNAVARLAGGATPEQARQELALLVKSYGAQYPETGEWHLRLEPLLGEVTGGSRHIVWLLLVAAGLVLVLACANVAGLSVARAVARAPELALRQALGAGRWQLLRVGLAENLLVGLTGAVLGVALAAAGAPLMRHLLPADFARAHEVALTPTAALLACAIAVGTALAGGLARGGARVAVRAGAGITAGRGARRLRSALVTAQLAVAGLLCGGALFLLRGYQQLGARDHGFEPAGVLTFQLSIPTTDNEVIARKQDEIRARIAELPGVAAVGATTNLPFSGYDENTGFDIVGRSFPDGEEPNARFQAATAGYFQAAGMHLLEGRTFDVASEARGQPLTLVVNDALAARWFPRGALGATLDVFGEQRQVVGVVAGVRDSPADLDVKPAFWFPLAQVPFADVHFAVRARGVDPASLTASVAAAVHGVDSELALADVRTLESRTAGALAARRFALWIFQSFAVLALVMSAAGVYALLAYLVQRRRKELGIRAALGATGAELGRMVLVDGLKLAALGALLCAVLIPAGGLLLRALLQEVRPLDAVTVAGAPAALLLAAALASLGPARSARRSDPARVLREE